MFGFGKTPHSTLKKRSRKEGRKPLKTPEKGQIVNLQNYIYTQQQSEGYRI
jgi:hypothetical protein